jgi:hypothetical protein
VACASRRISISLKSWEKRSSQTWRKEGVGALEGILVLILTAGAPRHTESSPASSPPGDSRPSMKARIMVSRIEMRPSRPKK